MADSTKRQGAARVAGTAAVADAVAPVVWDGAAPGGQWDDPTQWSSGQTPAATDAVVIPAAAAAAAFTVAVTDGQAASVLLDAAAGTLSVAGQLAVGDTLAVAQGQLAVQPDATLSAGGRVVIGTTAAADAVVSGSATTVTDDLTELGDSAGGAGTLTIDAASWNDGLSSGNSSDPLTGDMVIGAGGVGSLTLTDGAYLSDFNDVRFGGAGDSALVTGGAIWAVGGNMTAAGAGASVTVGDTISDGTVNVGGTIADLALTVVAGDVLAGTLSGGSVVMTGGYLFAVAVQDATLDLSNGASVNAMGLVGGDASLDATAALQVGQGIQAAPGSVLIDAGATASLTGALVAATLDVAGTLTTAGSLDFAGTLLGDGAIVAPLGADFAASAGFAGTIVLGCNTTLTLGTPGGFTGTVQATWAQPWSNETMTIIGIDLAGVSFTEAATLWNPTLGVTSLGTLAPFGVTAPGQSGADTTWSIASDGHGGTLLTYQATVPAGQAGTPCYAAGTRIATPAGARDVADLRPGDAVLVLEQGGWVARPLRWVGQFTVDLARHPAPDTAAPVLIRAGAIAAGVPARDLRVSPDHAVLLHGVLVPAHALVNGATVARDRACGQVTYHHIELDRHGVVLAEALPAESFRDTGNRGQFDAEAGVRPLFADLRGWHVTGDAAWPVALDAAELAAARARVLARARRLGWRRVRDPQVRLLADGWAVALTPVAPLQYRAILPHGTSAIRLLSRRFVPHDLDPANPDTRTLGIAVAGLWLNGHPVALGGAGWHAAEPHWRWTDGDAAVALLCGALELSCAAASPGYWVAPDQDAIRARAAARAER